jgi:hypothetical protein
LEEEQLRWPTHAQFQSLSGIEVPKPTSLALVSLASLAARKSSAIMPSGPAPSGMLVVNNEIAQRVVRPAGELSGLFMRDDGRDGVLEPFRLDRS